MALSSPTIEIRQSVCALLVTVLLGLGYIIGLHSVPQGRIASSPAEIENITPARIAAFSPEQRKAAADSFLSMLRDLSVQNVLPADLDFGRHRGVALGRHFLSYVLIPVLKAQHVVQGPRCLEWDKAYLMYPLAACKEPYVLRYPSRSACPLRRGHTGQYHVSDKVTEDQRKLFRRGERGFCADINGPSFATIPDGFFDSVICTQVFEHLPDPFAAAVQLGRILRPGGLLIWSAPQTSIFHADISDYWRYTVVGASELLTQHAKLCIKYAVGGNPVWLTAASLLGFSLNDFAPAKLLEWTNESDAVAPLNVFVLAVKPRVDQDCKEIPWPAALAKVWNAKRTDGFRHAYNRRAGGHTVTWPAAP